MKLSKIRMLAREHSMRALDPDAIPKRRKRRKYIRLWKPGEFWEWYTKYLDSSRWKMFRLSIFAARGARCEDCPSRKKLQLHHLTYKRVGREKPEDVRILCKDCHEKRHDKTPR